MSTMIMVAVVTAGVIGVMMLALRPSVPVSDLPPDEPLPSFRVESLGQVLSIGDALIYIDAVQGMHVERLRYRVLIRPDGTEMVEIYKVVADE